MRYTADQLRREYLRDLVVNIRCARRDGLPDYAARTEAELRLLWRVRHTAPLTCWGVPVISQVIDGAMRDILAGK